MAYNNGSLSQQQVKDMQAWYGTTADGKWGSNSSAAAGGLSAGQAYSLYSSNYKKYASYSDYNSYGSGGSGSSYGGSGSSKGNGSSYGSGIDKNTIKEMQEWYGTPADGIWGKNSTAAAGGKSLTDAYKEWSNTRRYYGSYADYTGAKKGGSSSSTPPSGGAGGGNGGGSYGGNAGGNAGGSASSGGGVSPTPDTGYGGYDSGYDDGYDYSGPMSYSDYLARVGGDDYQAAVQKAIEAQVQAATDQYNAQIENTGKEYEETARRAYVNKMMSQRNLDQEMAANGVYGGMADSQRIATETNYENNMHELTMQYQSTIAELEQAITNARLAGDAQSAEAMANYLSQVQAQYASYLQNERSIQAEVDMFNRQLAAQQEQEARAAAAAAASSGGGYSSGYSGGGGGSYDADVAVLQQELNARGANLTVDGVWGPKTAAAYEQYLGSGTQQPKPGNIVGTAISNWR